MSRTQLIGVREYAEQMPVFLEVLQPEEDDERFARFGPTKEEGPRLVLTATNEGGHNCTQVDVGELIAWIKANWPELLT